MATRPLAGLAAALVGGLFLAGAVAYHRSLGAVADVGRPAPDWVLPDLEGRSRRLTEWRGQAVLLNFWTTWCEPCREEIPALDTFHRRFGQRLAVVGVNVREPLPTVQQFVQEFAMAYPVVRDSDGKVADRYRVRGFPESWLVDEQGILRRVWPGPLTFEALEEAYRQLAGRPITAGLPDGGPLAADEEAVGLVRVGPWVLLASTSRLLAAPVGADGSVGPWREVPLPDSEVPRETGAGSAGSGGARARGSPSGPIRALSAWPGQAAVAVAVGERLWRYEPDSGRWARTDERLASRAAADRSNPLAAPAAETVPAANGLHLVTARGAEDGRYLATKRGVARRTRPGGEPVPVPGTPVRAFVAVAELPAGWVLAVAQDGDLYQYDPRQGAAGWRLFPLPRDGGLAHGTGQAGA